MSTLGFIQGVGGPELLIIFTVVFMLFGAKKMPELARGLAQSVRELRNVGKELIEDGK